MREVKISGECVQPGKSVSYTFPKKNLTGTVHESGAPAGIATNRRTNTPPAGSSGVQRLLRPNLELHLPAPIGIHVLHPELQRAQLRHHGVDPHRHHLPGREVVAAAESRSPAGWSPPAPARHRPAPRPLIAAAHGRGEEPEIRRPARHQPELPPLDHQVRALLHPLRHHAQRLDRRV